MKSKYALSVHSHLTLDEEKKQQDENQSKIWRKEKCVHVPVWNTMHYQQTHHKSSKWILMKVS